MGRLFVCVYICVQAGVGFTLWIFSHASISTYPSEDTCCTGWEAVCVCVCVCVLSGKAGKHRNHTVKSAFSKAVMYAFEHV